MQSSPARTSPARTSPARTWPARTWPARTWPAPISLAPILMAPTSLTWSTTFRPGGLMASPHPDVRNVLVQRGPRDPQQPRDRGHCLIGPGQQRAGLADLLLVHGRWPAEALPAG